MCGANQSALTMPGSNQPICSWRSWEIAPYKIGVAHVAGGGRLSYLAFNRFVENGRQPVAAMNVERNSIRESCANLRKLLASVKPAGAEAILQEVATVECDALVADSNDLRSVEEKLTGLIRRLMGQGVIDAERWKQFFSETKR